MSSSFPLRKIWSWACSSLAVIVVLACSSAWSSVPLSDELIGRISFSSRLPQYLMTAMFTGAVQVTAVSPALLRLADMARGWRPVCHNRTEVWPMAAAVAASEHVDVAEAVQMLHPRVLISLSRDPGEAPVLDYSAVDPTVVQLPTTRGTATFRCSHIFPENTGAEAIAEHLTATQTAQSLLDGFNVCFMTYGESTAEHGLLMASRRRGLVQMLVEALFSTIESRHAPNVTTELQLQYMLVYSEQLTDLLVDGRPRRRIREKPRGSVYIQDAETVCLQSPGHFEKVFEEAETRIYTFACMLSHSSRRHSRYMNIKVVQTTTDPDTGKPVHMLSSNLHCSRSGGSERLANFRFDLPEAKTIGRSLSTMGNVVMALSDPSRKFVPYRDSCMTRLLQDGLGGSCLTTLILCLRDSTQHQIETLSSLRFASRFAKIVNHVRRSEAEPLDNTSANPASAAETSVSAGAACTLVNTASADTVSADTVSAAAESTVPAETAPVSGTAASTDSAPAAANAASTESASVG
eukprot:m.244104 g.244104  ORF g.244104 m.244104 type:complete len:521 (-) comp22557_c1_seq6:84-1646(-)